MDICIVCLFCLNIKDLLIILGGLIFLLKKFCKIIDYYLLIYDRVMF